MPKTKTTTLFVDGFEPETLSLTLAEAVAFARGVFTLATVLADEPSKEQRLLLVEEALEDLRRSGCGEVGQHRVCFG